MEHRACERCGRDDVFVLRFDGLGRSTFAFCRSCEHAQWRDGSDEPVQTAEILAVAAATPPPRRRKRSA